MRLLRPLLALAIPLVAFALAAVLLGGDPRAYAGGDTPTPPAGTPPGMGEPAKGDPGMSDAPGDDDAEDPDVPTSTDEKIKNAIKKGVAWLKARQLPDGSWGVIDGGKAYEGKADEAHIYKHPAGPTALALYALLKSKEPVDDPIVKKGFKYLQSKFKIPGGAYECSMMLLAVTATADPFKKTKASEAQGDKIKFPGAEWKDWAQKLHDALIDKKKKAKSMGWRYMHGGTEPDGKNADNSGTQLAALALLAAERCGIKTDNQVWNDMATFALDQQDADGQPWDRAVYDRTPKDLDRSKLGDKDKGRYAPAAGDKPAKDKARGFAYIKGLKNPDEGAATGGMTACAIGTIMMARYVLTKADRNDETWKKRDQAQIQQAIYDGCAWLDQNYSTWANPQKKTTNVYNVYYLYCCERAFDLIDNLLLGKNHWYLDMAEQICARQDAKGFWKSDTTLNPQDVLDTCFALLFLKRSTRGGIPFGSITGGGDDPPADSR
jgi:hypothetical protein